MYSSFGKNPLENNARLFMFASGNPWLRTCCFSQRRSQLHTHSSSHPVPPAPAAVGDLEQACHRRRRPAFYHFEHAPPVVCGEFHCEGHATSPHLCYPSPPARPANSARGPCRPHQPHYPARDPSCPPSRSRPCARHKGKLTAAASHPSADGSSLGSSPAQARQGARAPAAPGSSGCSGSPPQASAHFNRRPAPQGRHGVVCGVGKLARDALTR